MIDLNKFEMVQKAARELFEAVQKNYYEFSDLKDLNYSEICEWCGWPRENGISGSTPLAGANIKFTAI